ncbi:MAG: anthranilate phosphoribosyltransferase [Leptospirales bacterium]|nr:anthranilate phosphoribosyltransferase [Leptospirales bacterium]
MQDILKKLIASQDLTSEEAARAMTTIMTGEAGEAQTAAFLTALAMKRETPVEIEGFARSMRKAAVTWKSNPLETVVDTCGTGGDGQNTINVSTLSALVLAAAGLKVAKHGNRAVSSATGSADLLETLGVSLTVQSPEALAHCIEKAGIAFLFAQAWHPAMKHAGPVRRALGFRTVFNILGPLTNPAPVTHQLVGVFDPRFLEPVAKTLLNLGRTVAYVLHADDGLDEISPAASTRYFQIKEGRIESGTFTAADFGFKSFPLGAIVVKDRDEAVARARAILSGKGSDEENAAVAMNAAPLYHATFGGDLKSAAGACIEIIKNGKAGGTLEQWKQISSDKS